MHGLILFDISFLLILVISDQIDFIFLGGCNLDKEKDSSKDVKRLDKSEKKRKESTSSGQAEDFNKKEKNGNGLKGITAAEEKGDWMRRIMD